MNYYIETYGCQMNFADSEIVASIMNDNDYKLTKDIKNADVIFVNTCSIRDNAEQRVRNRFKEFYSLKKKRPSLIVGMLGCMAERLKDQLLEEERILDLIVGPDAYKDIPLLIENVRKGVKGINVILSSNETYSEIQPVRIDSNGITAFISIMRGCQNFCSYCVVPYTRGKERSRSADTIITEAKRLFENGYREVTLLGQNVNSYNFTSDKASISFARLLSDVAAINPLLRVRFATSHPKDMSDELLHTIADHPNICRSIHLPVQSGNNRILGLMNRKYTREWYMNRIEAIHRIIPDCSVSTDIIAGFPGETETEHNDTLSLMEWARFEFAYMFKYSERPNTAAAKKYTDDIPEEIKIRRLEEIIKLQNKLSYESNIKDINKTHEVLIEGVSKRSKSHLFGRNSQNKVIIFPAGEHKPGEYVNVFVNRCTPATLIADK